MKNAIKAYLIWFMMGGLFFVSPKLLAQYTLNYTTNGTVVTLTGYTGTPVNVTIPSGVGIVAGGAFYLCGSLTNVTIPNSVTNIGFTAFDNCSSLATITVTGGNQYFSSVGGVLFNQNQTALLQYPGGVSGAYPIPNTVTDIEAWAFSDCIFLTGVTIPNKVATIGYSAFAYCFDLTSVTIPNSVTNIGDSAFLECTHLTAISVNTGDSDYSSVNGVLFGQNGTVLEEYPFGLTGNYTVPNGVTSIGDDAFVNCVNLTGLTIPGTVTNIGFSAFSDCTGLTNLIVPGSVTGLAGSAFRYCTGLTNIFFEGNAPSADSTVFSYAPATAYYLYGTTGWSAFSANTGIPAVPINPPVSTAAGFGVQSKKFNFTINGPTNLAVVVEVCTNLANPVWLPWQTNVLAAGSFDFTDPAVTNTSARFYRVEYPLP